MNFLVTKEEMKRFKIMNLVKEKKLNLINASKILNLSYRHTIRLSAKFKAKGLEGLIKKYNNKNKTEK